MKQIFGFLENTVHSSFSIVLNQFSSFILKRTFIFKLVKSVNQMLYTQTFKDFQVPDMSI